MRRDPTTPIATPTSIAATRVRQKRLLVVATSAATLDLSTKASASTWLTGSRVDLPGPLDLQLAYNPGVAFGLGGAAPAWLMFALSACVAGFLAIAAWRGMFTSATGAGLVVGGAIANLADRLQAGTVVDMLHLGWWPTFNLADVCITVGLVLTVVGESHWRQRRACPEPLERPTDDRWPRRAAR